MISFAVAVFFLILSPGPGVLSAAGFGAAYGRSSGLSYVMGLWIGNNLVSFLVITGLATLVIITAGNKTDQLCNGGEPCHCCDIVIYIPVQIGFDNE